MRQSVSLGRIFRADGTGGGARIRLRFFTDRAGVYGGAIGGGTIRVLQKDTATVLGIFHTSPGCARIGSIEGDNVEFENVEAEIVRGKYVRIGHGCRIGTVEYGENLEAEPGTVRQSTQTGTK